MSDAYLESDLTLDIRSALQQVDRLNETLSRGTTNIPVTADTRAVTLAIDAAVQAADAAVAVSADALPVTAAIDSAVEQADTDVEVTGQAGAVTGAIDGAVAAADTSVEVTGQVSPGLKDDVEEVADDAERAADGTDRLKQALAGLSAIAVARGLFELADAASELEQSIGGTEAVFGESAAVIQAFAEGADTAAGITETAARNLTSQIGGLLKGFGFTRQEAAATSVQLAQLGADLAATFGGRPQDAVEALGGALRGEFNPLERFGVSLNVAQINAYALANGMAQSEKDITLSVRAQAALRLIMERTADAQGQFNREMNTAGGVMAAARAEAGNLSSEAGAHLTPALLALVGVLREEVLPGLGEAAEDLLPALSDALIALAPLLGTTTDLIVTLAPVLAGLLSIVAAVPTPVFQIVGAWVAVNTILKLIPQAGGLAGKSMRLLGGDAAAASRPVSVFAGTLGRLRAGLATPLGRRAGVVAGVAALTAVIGTGGGDDIGAFAGEIVNLADSLTFGFGGRRQDRVSDEIGRLTESLDMSSLQDQQQAVRLLNDELENLGSEEGKGRLFSLGGLNVFGTGGDADRQERIDQLRDQIDTLNETADAEIEVGIATGRYTAAQVAAARVTADRTNNVGQSIAALETLREEEEAAALAAQETLDTYGPVAAQYVETAEALERLRATAPGVSRAVDDIRVAVAPTQRQFFDLAVQIGQAELAEEDMADAAALLGTDLETLTAITEQATDALNDFVDDAVGNLPTLGDAFQEAGDDGILSVQEFLRNLRDSTTGIRDWRNNLEAIRAAGFADIAGYLAQQGPEIAGTLATEMATAAAEGNVAFLEEVRAGLAEFRTEWDTTAEYFRETLGPEFILQAGLLGQGLTTAFGQDLDFGERIRIAGEVAALEMSREGQAVAAIAAVEGDRAARDYGAALDLDQQTIDAAVAAGRVIAGDTSLPTAMENLGDRSGARLTSGVASGVNRTLGAVRAAMDAVENAASAALGRVFQFGSPSRLMMQYGEWIGEGLADGIDQQVTTVAAASSALAEAARVAVEEAQAPAITFDRAQVDPRALQDVQTAADAGQAAGAPSITIEFGDVSIVIPDGDPATVDAAAERFTATTTGELRREIGTLARTL